MPLRIYNTLKRAKEEFVPLTPGKVGMYVCGVTVYDHCHIGHARSQVVFDVISRYLRHQGYQVSYVRNFTDVDDKIINRANERGIDCRALSQEFIEAFYHDMDALNVKRPEHEPRATESMDQIITLVKKIEKNGLAYEKNGNVYFSVRKFPDYGKLSRRDIDEMRSGARVSVDEQKKDPLDFALWKASKPGEPAWSSPWGQGRPGWHIECSAMSTSHLGETFDIHGGGQDLIFPHHENEIAQSECAHGKPYVRYWIHNGFVQVNHEKMSKSLGNFFTIRDVLETINVDVLRFFLLAAHYRSPLDYHDGALAEAREAVDRVFTAWENLRSSLSTPVAMDEARLTPAQKELRPAFQKIRTELETAMDDDFNTPRALGQLFELATLINTVITKGKLKDDPGRAMLLTEADETLAVFRRILGFPINEPEVFRRRCAEIVMAKHHLTTQEIETRIASRNQARQVKNWAQADALRRELEEIGIMLKDTPQGTTWYAK